MTPESQRASRGGPDWLKARNERHFYAMHLTWV